MLNFKFSQLFGGTAAEVQQADIVSALSFDDTGNYLAVGDHGGRVVIFKQAETKATKHLEYEFWIEFQSHESEFDYLKSVEIEERINQIKWLPRRNQNHFLLTTNDKTIKLWRLSERKIQTVSNLNIEENDDNDEVTSLKIPTLSVSDVTTVAVPRRVYGDAHMYHINTISLNSDHETYMSADDLRINLWNLEVAKESFNIVDIKPDNMDDLTEVITSASFHPNQCNLFIYSSSKGTIHLGDMRQAALCDSSQKVFWEKEEEKSKSFFSELISSISDAKFSNDGRYILSRDYLSLKLWDLKKETKPIKKINIHDHLRSKLCELYESDCIFDKFKCGFSGNGKYPQCLLLHIDKLFYLVFNIE